MHINSRARCRTSLLPVQFPERCMYNSTAQMTSIDPLLKNIQICSYPTTSIFTLSQNMSLDPISSNPAIPYPKTWGYTPSSGLVSLIYTTVVADLTGRHWH